MKNIVLLLFVLSFLLFSCNTTKQAQKSTAKEGTEKSDKDKKKESYDKLLKDATFAEGLFNVIQKDGKTYFEIQDSILDEEFLVVSRIKGHVKNLNFGGAGMKSRPQQVIRWQKIDENIVLRSVSYNSIADEDLPVYTSVKQNNFEPVIASFEVKTKNNDSTSYVIDVTELFTTDIPMIGAVSAGQVKKFGLKGVDKSRSMVTSVAAFPQNVEIRHILTYKGGAKIPDNKLTGALSVEMNQSFIKLPEERMQPRFYDPRVGYFSLSRINYGLDAQRAERERLITRWRLEPVDMEAWQRGELVDVRKPIVYYIDPSTPAEWAPYIKQGVDDWKVAFEAIGLKDAIRGEYAPTKEENPDWSPEDVRYSVIRYVTTDIQNAQGPHVHDPRTGEILESDIIWYHNVMNLLRNWYLIQTSAVNEKARGLKFAPEVMGELIRFVSAHEVGHTLGLPHNMGSSAAFPVDSLRSPGFVQEYGVAPSIMDYARFNYVAQPEDKGAGLYPKVGLYDFWSIKYGYMPLPEVDSPEAEREILNKMIIEKADDPRFRYGRQRSRGHDPSAQTEDIGDDPVYASELGIKNLKRIVPQLIEWSSEDAKFFDDLEEIYDQVVGQLNRYSGHVSSNIGGVYEHQRSADENKIVYEVVPSQRQKEAVDFMNKNIFTTPEWLIQDDILQRISPSGVAGKIEGLQKRALGNMLMTSRLDRLVEQRAVYGSQQYGIDDLLGSLSDHIFRKEGSNDAYGRNLQTAFIQELGDILRNENSSADVKAAVRMIYAEIVGKFKKVENIKNPTLQQAHQLEILRLIEQEINGVNSILKNKK